MFRKLGALGLFVFFTTVFDAYANDLVGTKWERVWRGEVQRDRTLEFHKSGNILISTDLGMSVVKWQDLGDRRFTVSNVLFTLVCGYHISGENLEVSGCDGPLSGNWRRAGYEGLGKATPVDSSTCTNHRIPEIPNLSEIEGRIAACGRVLNDAGTTQ